MKTEDRRFLISILVCVAVAFLLAHPATRPIFFAIFPFFRRAWRFFLYAAVIGAVVFGIHYGVSMIFRPKKINRY